MKLSAVLIVYKEEDLIGRCLDNIKDAVDEIIVVHDGPAVDKTLEIAGKYTDKIYAADRVGFCEGHYNSAIEKASGDWILFIDADEALSPELKKNLRELISRRDADGYAFRWDFYNYRGRHRYQYKTCLFRKSKIKRFQGITHEPRVVLGNLVKNSLILEHNPKASPYTMNEFLKRKGKSWALKQAEHTPKNRPALFYLAKTVLLVPFYFIIESVRYYSLRIGFFSALYNGIVWWNVFKIKLKG